MADSELEFVVLRHLRGAEATIYLQGAHVTRFVEKPDGENLLFLSKAAIFRRGTAIRGGIPVIFPQFSDMGAMPKHGFARTSLWTLHKHEGPGGVFRLQSSNETKKIWPVDFTLDLVVEIVYESESENCHPTLRIEFLFQNGEKNSEFSAALHTYFSVDSIEKVSISGLGQPSSLQYLDNLDNRSVKGEENKEIQIQGEVDRIYLKTEKDAFIKQAQGGLHLQIETPQNEEGGFSDKVVWNPAEKKCKSIGDLVDDDYLRFLCVEAAQVRPNVSVQPNQSWKAVQNIRLVPHL